MLFAIINFMATFLMSLILKDISGMSPSEKKAIFMSKSARIKQGSRDATPLGNANGIHGGSNTTKNVKEVDESIDSH